MPKRIFLLIFLNFLLSQPLLYPSPKDTIKVEFDGKGKIISNLPNKISDSGSAFSPSYKDLEGVKMDAYFPIVERMIATYNYLNTIISNNKLENKFGYLVKDTRIIIAIRDTLDDRLCKLNEKYPKMLIGSKTNKALVGYDYNANSPTAAAKKFVPDPIIETPLSSSSNINDGLKKIEFEIRLQNKSNQIIREWLKNKLNYNKPLPSDSSLVKLISFYDSAKKEIALYDGVNCGKIKSLNIQFGLLNNDISKIDDFDIEDWILYWLWYTGGIPKTNPLGIRNPREIIRPSILDSIIYYNKLLETTEKMAGRMSLDCKCQNQIDSLSRKIANYNLVLKEIDETKNQYEKNLKDNNDRLRQLSMNDELLYKGFLYYSTNENTKWMRHHDASNDYCSINKQNINDYEVGDEVRILGQNVPDSIEVRLFTKFEPEEDISFIRKQLEPIFNGLKDVFNKITFVKVNEYTTERKPPTCDLEYNELVEILNDNMNSFTKALFLKSQTNMLLEISSSQDDTPKYRTDEAGPNSRTDQTGKIKYVLKEFTKGKDKDTGKVVVDTLTYSMYKKHSVQLFAGASYAWEDVKYSTLVEGKPTFVTDERLTFIAGVKIYLQPCDIRSKKLCFTSGDLWWSRLTVLLGVDLRKPLNNLHAGLGVDLFPGLNLGLDCRLNKNTQYKSSLGSYSADHIYYNNYWCISLTVDPQLFISFFQIFK